MATAGLMRAVASVPFDSGSITVSCTDATIGAIVKPLNNCLFNWAEVTLPAYFSPRTESLSSGLYYFRTYANTSACLGVSSNRLLYLGPEPANNMLDLGPALTWFTTAGCLG
jgi:hypothetical protein